MTIGVGDSQGQRFEDVEVMVDTGSTYTAVSRELLQRLGVPVERSLPSETADGRIVPVDVGRTVIRLEGLGFSTPMIFAEKGEPSLLGVVSLEEAAPGVDPPGVDPLAGRLIPPLGVGTGQDPVARTPRPAFGRPSRATSRRTIRPVIMLRVICLAK